MLNVTYVKQTRITRLSLYQKIEVYRIRCLRGMCSMLLSKCNIFYCAHSLYTAIDIHEKIHADTFNISNASRSLCEAIKSSSLSIHHTLHFPQRKLSNKRISNQPTVAFIHSTYLFPRLAITISKVHPMHSPLQPTAIN